MKDNTFLRTEPIGRLLLKLALPTVAAQLINMLYNIVDRVYIGHMAGGALALTGLGVCLPVIMVITAFSSLVSAGGASRASIAMGEGKNDRAESIMGNCFSLQLLISAVLTTVLLIWKEPILSLFGASENTLPYASAYMGIYALGTIFVQLTLGLNAFITAQGFSKMSMLTVLIGAILNICLDPIFIFTFHMGVKGAAIATIISQGVSCLWVLCFLSGKKTVIRLKPSYFRMNPKIILPCVALGLAPFIMTASESVISMCFNSSLLKYGGDIAVGAMTILVSVMQFGMLPLQGLGQGAQPIISYNYGAGDGARVKAAYKLLLKVSLLCSVAIWALIMAFPNIFAGIFTGDAALSAYASNAMRIYFAVMLIFGIQIACQMAFIAIGNAASSIIVAVMRKFVLLLPLIYIMPALFPANKASAVYAAEPVADIIAVTFTALLFAAQFKKAMAKLEAFSREKAECDTGAALNN